MLIPNYVLLFVVSKNSYRIFCLYVRALIRCGVRNWLETQGISPNNALTHALTFSGLMVCFLKIKNSFKVI
jgi:hypothetical protein